MYIYIYTYIYIYIFVQIVIHGCCDSNTQNMFAGSNTLGTCSLVRTPASVGRLRSEAPSPCNSVEPVST